MIRFGRRPGGRRAAQRGLALLSALALITVLLILGAAHALMMRQELQMTRNETEISQAFYFAEAGAQHALAEFIEGVDSDGNGLGTIMLTDLDGDGDMDYEVNYDDVSYELYAIGTEGDARQVVRMSVEAGQKWTGPLQAGGDIAASIANSGTLFGDVHANGAISTSAGLVTTGTVNPFSSMTVPTVNVADYQGMATDQDTGAVTWQPPFVPPDGVHYIQGNLTITMYSDFTLNGSIIVSGTLTMSSMTGSVNINASGNMPALLAGQDITLTAVWEPQITGLVYAGRDLNLWSINNSGGAVIFGALVADRNIDMQWSTNMYVDFDPDLDPPFFDSPVSGDLTIEAWQGHDD